MRCRNFEKWIILELSGELGGRETAALERHLEGCRSCRELRLEYRQLRAGLAEVEPAPVPFISRAWKVRAEGRLPRPVFWRPRILASSLAMVMILAVVGFIYLDQPESPLWNEAVLAGLEGPAPVTTGTIRIQGPEPVPAVLARVETPTAPRVVRRTAVSTESTARAGVVTIDYQPVLNNLDSEEKEMLLTILREI